MAHKTLPSQPSLKSLKHQAKQFLRTHKAGKDEAYQRLQASHPRCSHLSLEAVKEFPCSHADALLLLAREYGFSSWNQLTDAVEHALGAPAQDTGLIANEPGWEWIIPPNPDHPLGTNGGISGNGFCLMYENKNAHDALSAHVAVGTEFITREWRLVALESDGKRHHPKEHGSSGCGFDLALLGFRLPYAQVPHGTIQYLGIEAVC